jgi:PPK2 family polyphosphate:nucleotide phosphotransferase
MADSLRDALRAPAAPVLISRLDPRATPLAPGDKDHTRDVTITDGQRLAELQEWLFAEGATGGRRRVLLVLQGMDTSGKGGVVRHVVGAVQPQGVQYRAFKRPTGEELSHGFLWRIRRAVPEPGMLGVFDRSHYEDVLAGSVRGTVASQVVDRRHREIVRFEQRLAEDGVALVKVFLHLSPWEQKERLLARLDDSAKQWKFDPQDIDDRALWPAYMRAYETVIERTDSDVAPWYVVPSDRKWYRNWAVGRLLLETLVDLDPRLPGPTYDVAAQRDRLIEEHPFG